MSLLWYILHFQELVAHFIYVTYYIKRVTTSWTDGTVKMMQIWNGLEWFKVHPFKLPKGLMRAFSNSGRPNQVTQLIFAI